MPQSFWNGIYSAYMTGAEGQGFAMLVFYDGVIAGADALGAQFDGEYEESDDGTLQGSIKVSIPAGETVIQGASAGAAGLVYNVPITLTPAELEADYVPIATDLGAVNVRLEKLRSLGNRK